MYPYIEERFRVKIEEIFGGDYKNEKN
jgi:hypothetical protein